MYASLNRWFDAAKPKRKQRTLQLENLEDRMLLYAFNGGEWTFPNRITYSFAPDGTSVGGIESNLNAAFAARGISTQSWQSQFRKAAATWQAITNTNFVEVGDSGDAFGVSGNQQGDSRFGDIRIAGVAQEPSLLGLAYLPPPLNGGTLAGDIVMNSAVAWKINSNYDVLTVGLHEFGHSLGLDHSTIQSAVMYASYTGVKQSLAGDDTCGIREIYSARQKDAFDAIHSNDSYSYATNITSYIDSNAQIRIGGLDVGMLDHDWYYAVVPENTSGTMTVTVQSSQLSSLSPRVYVHASTLQILGFASSTAYGATVTVTINGVSPGQGFYYRVNAATGGSSITGNYGLLVNFGSDPIDPIAPPDTTVAEQRDQGGGSSGMNMGSLEGAVSVGNLSGQADAFRIDAHEGAQPQAKPQPPRTPWVVFVAMDATADTANPAADKAKSRRSRAVDRVLRDWN